VLTMALGKPASYFHRSAALLLTLLVNLHLFLPGYLSAAPKKIKIGSSDIKHICRLIAADHRQITFFRILKDGEAKASAGCASCKVFFKAMSSRCKPKKERKVKKVRETKHVAPVVAIDPSTELLNVLSRVFISLETEFERIDDERLQVIQIFVGLLRLNPSFTEDEKVYFKTLVSFIEAPFLHRMKFQKFRNRKQKLEIRVGEALKVFE
jgi:hypothetical protein